MEWIANLVYWVFAASAVAGFGVIVFLWERMRRDLNLTLSAKQKISIHPSPRRSLREMIHEANGLGHFVEVLDQYQAVYPCSDLPKKLALGLVAWILYFMGLLASGVGR